MLKSQTGVMAWTLRDQDRVVADVVDDRIPQQQHLVHELLAAIGHSGSRIIWSPNWNPQPATTNSGIPSQLAIRRRSL